VSAVALALAGAAPGAFDADAWDERNAEMMEDALRMKSVYEAVSAKVVDPASDVTIPFEKFDDGTVKSFVFAKRGQLFPFSRCVWAEGVTVKQLRRDGSVDMQLNADRCLVDLNRRSCWVSGHVRAARDRTVIEGDDAYCNVSNDFLKVMSNAKVVSEDVNMKGLRL